ncbi:MAG: flagellar protein FlgN [Gammaproteobacteria bacterium]|nr:flagellar protein FlgN [Gammaproteobacteria bacterium]
MNSSRTLRELMAREQDGLVRLHRLLEAEHAAIAARDTATLERLAADKLSLLAELEGFAKERQAMLQKTGLTADRAGFEALLGREGDDTPALMSQWDTLRDLLEACQEQNRVNGLVLDASHRATQQALGILLGQTREAETYDARGAVRNGSFRHTSIKA